MKPHRDHCVCMACQRAFIERYASGCSYGRRPVDSAQLVVAADRHKRLDEELDELLGEDAG